MTVDPATALFAAHDGREFHFCSSGCRDAFVGDPDAHLSSKELNRYAHPRAGFR